MRIAICDNDLKDAVTLKDMCASADSDSIHSYSIFTEGAKLCETYYNGAKQFDLVFLDIEMPGMNGIEAGRRIRHYDPNVVIGLISGDKKTKAVFLAVCYLYTVTMVWIVPVIWNIDKDITSIRLILEAVIVFGSIFSLCIIPCFAISTFTAWVAKALLIKIKRKKFDR